MAPQSHGSTLEHLERQISRTASAATISATSSDNDDWTAKLAAQAERSWTVSGTSVLSAWIMAFVGSLLILAFFSWRRRKDPMIHLPRYLSLISREPSLKSKRDPGQWFPYIPSSDPTLRPMDRSDEERQCAIAQIAAEDEAYQMKRRKIGGVERKIQGMEIRDGECWYAWIRPAWRDFCVEINVFDRKKAMERDKQLLIYLGLDAFTFLEFLRLLRWLFALITIFVALPLLCANYFINTRTEWGSSQSSSTSQMIGGNVTSAIGDLQLFTAANITGNAWWVHISAEFIVTMIVAMQVLIYSRRHERTIEQWSDMNSQEVAFKTIMITGLEIKYKPKTLTIRQAKNQILLKIGCGIDEPVEITIKQENMGKLAEKIKLWNEVERPKVAARLQRWADEQEAKSKGLDVGDHGDGGGGCLGMLKGEKWMSTSDLVSQAVLYRAARIMDQKHLKQKEKTNEHVQLVHADVTAAFVTWRTANEAHSKLQQLQLKKNKGFKVERCPRSSSVLWRNLEKDPKTIASQNLTSALIRWLIIIANSIPVMFITILTNLDGYINGNPTLKTMRETSTFWNTIFTAAAGILPASLAAIFIMALPYIMRALSRFQGALSTGQLDKDVIRQMFIFLLLSKFVVFSLMGIGYETYQSIKDQIGINDFKAIFDSLGDVPAKITKAYISQSSYWLSFFPIKCAVVCLQTLQLWRYIIKGWDTYVTRAANTADRLEDAAQPAEFEYAIEYTNILFGLVVALVYTPLAPIVSICGAMYFWTASIVYQNQLTFVEISMETDGKVWTVVMNRLLVALSLMQILMTLTVLLKTQPFTTSPLPLLPRILPSIFAFLPLGFSIWLANHVRTRRTTAQIISETLTSSNHSSSSSISRKIPKFDLDILRPDAIKDIRIFPRQVELFLGKDGKEEIKGVGKLLPQVQEKAGRIQKEKKIERDRERREVKETRARVRAEKWERERDRDRERSKEKEKRRKEIRDQREKEREKNGGNNRRYRG